MNKLLLTAFWLLSSAYLFSQREYAVEYQHGFGKSYNSNSIGGLFENFSNGNGSWNVVAHYTWDVFTTAKKIRGVSDLGLSIGYRYGLSYGDHGNLLSGIRLTFSHVIEKNYTRLTPSAEFGYHYTFNSLYDRGAFTTPSIALGYDIPIGKEKKEEYAGFLFIPRLAVGYHSAY